MFAGVLFSLGLYELQYFGPNYGSTAAMSHAALLACGHVYKYTTPPTVPSETLVYPILLPQNISESVAIANFIGLSDCAGREITTKDALARSMMWSNKIDTLYRLTLELWMSSVSNGYNLVAKNSFARKHVAAGTGSLRDDAGESVSGGDHLDYFEKRYASGGFLASTIPTYTDFMLLSLYDVALVPVFGSGILDKRPNTKRAFRYLDAAIPHFVTEMAKRPRIPLSLSTPSVDTFSSPLFVSNYINYFGGTDVYVLFASVEACPLFFSTACSSQARLLNDAWPKFVAEMSSRHPTALFLRANADACACNCAQCGRNVCDKDTCKCPYTPMIKVFGDEDSTMRHPSISSASDILYERELWIQLS
jgi:glutathione S-transferase